MQPQYDENIIVCAVHDKKAQWYVAEKSTWILDLKKYHLTNFSDHEVPDMQPDDLRFGMDVLDETTCNEFLQRIEEYQASCDELHEQLLNRFNAIIARSKREDIPYHVSFDLEDEGNDHPDDILDFAPVLYVDFDHKLLFSQYPEPLSYEKYIPDGWEGRYSYFKHLIPQEMVYWLDPSGRNLFDEVNPLRDEFYRKPVK